jgi:hypothetical protein
MCTIVGYLFISHRKALPKPLVAVLLLQAILSDALNIRSVTTTDSDQSVVALLVSYGGIGKVKTRATPSPIPSDLYKDEAIDLLAKRQFQAKNQLDRCTWPGRDGSRRPNRLCFWSMATWNQRPGSDRHFRSHEM